MDQLTALVLVAAAGVGLIAAIWIARGESRATEPHESQFATSTEGMKRCPNCGRGNLVTDATCLYCGHSLPG